MNTGQTALLMEAEDGASLWHDAWLRLKKNRAAVTGGVVLAMMVVLAILTPWIAPYGYEAQNLDLGATPPSAAHWLGTDIFGRDLLTQILYGGRISLAVGFIATAVALVIGVTWGAVAGYVGGRIDSVMMRFVDILYALPFMIFIILLMVVFGRNILLLFLAIGAVEWADHGENHADSGAILASAGICRSGRIVGTTPLGHHFQTHHPQRPRPHHCLYNADNSERDVAGGIPKLPGARHSATADQLGTAD